MSIDLNNLCFAYDKKIVLKDINLKINQGEIISILGTNGAGKTTLLSIIAGLRSFEKGELSYDGKKIKNMSRNEVARLIGYVPQIIVPTFDFSVVEYVVTGIAPYIDTFSKPTQKHYDDAMEIIKTLGIEHIAEKSYRQISGGERQQVSIARAIMQKPKYILFDEPTAHLDYGKQIQILKLMKNLSEQGYGVVYTTHNPDHVLLLGGKVAIVEKNGTLRFGETRDMINEKSLSELYDVNINLKRLDESEREFCYIPNL